MKISLKLNWLLVCVAAISLVWVASLSGCGSGATESSGPAVASTQDECLFAGEDNPEKADHSASMSKDVSEKANLKPDGSWRSDTVAEGTWERHRINTKKGYTYIVELCAQTAGSEDDPDLYLSRDEDPYHNSWKSSSFSDPKPDVIVFRAKQDGRMYVAVRGWDSKDDNNVDYLIRVRRRLNPPRG